MRESSIASLKSNIGEEFDPGLYREMQADLLAWIDDGRDDDEGGPLPTWDAPAFEPDPLDAAYQLGYALGREGEYPRTPARYSERERYFFHCGRLAGFVDSEDGRAWYRDLDTLEDRPAERDAREAVEAIGAIEARKG